MSANSSASAASDRAEQVEEKQPDSVSAQGEEEEEEQKAQSPPVALCHDGLECVFDFLSIRGLGRAMAVSRFWFDAVVRMPCARLQVRCPSVHVVSLCASALTKHVLAITNAHAATIECELSNESMYILALRMPHLTMLHCLLLPSLADRLIFPHRLTGLVLDLSKLTAATINEAVKCVAHLKALVGLGVIVPSFLSAISFAPLAAVASLQELELKSALTTAQPTAAQMDQLRALPQLHRISVDRLSIQSLTQLLHPPHHLRWQEIPLAKGVDVAASAALSSLPSLTTLMAWSCTDVAFLRQLVQLRTLDLQMEHHPWPATITAEAVVNGLAHCAQITDLKITAPLNSKHLTVLLPRLPSLTMLWLRCMNELESLACFCRGPVVHRLRTLWIFRCRHAALHSSELRHLYALNALQQLTLTESFVESLTPLELFLHTPPSRAIPTLTRFDYTKP